MRLKKGVSQQNQDGGYVSPKQQYKNFSKMSKHHLNSLILCVCIASSCDARRSACAEEQTYPAFALRDQTLTVIPEAQQLDPEGML